VVGRENRLCKLEQRAADRQIRQALELARSGSRADFARTFVENLPPGKQPGTIQADLDLLSDTELDLLAEAKMGFSPNPVHGKHS
jgi:hypothetical protein